jgi:predicted NBD/HSP70 family sugar kinase
MKVATEIKVNAAVKPSLDPEFIPAVLWNKAYREAVSATSGSLKLAIILERGDGIRSRYNTEILPHTAENAAVNFKYVERLVKFLLWMKGGHQVIIAGCDTLAQEISAEYSATGKRAFDFKIMGDKIYGKPFTIKSCSYAEAPEAHETQIKMGGNFNGCRIGFDLGGSDRKCAAVIDGKTVFSEEIPWSPYFETNPEYHLDGIRDSLQRAAAKLPRLDAIGGSAAGVYVNNEPRIASLFRGVSEDDFKKHIVNIFHTLQKEMNDVPMVIANDGDVTALAGALSMDSTGVLGISMGTSQAVGYVNLNGNVTDWLNELAFAPVDYRDDAPVDEWSGDIGCGVQYFSQQGVARLAKAAGIEFPEDMPLPERLEKIQEMMKNGDKRAAEIYDAIGVCFGYAIAHYAEFYEIRNLLILGRVSSGEGGEIILQTAEKVLKQEFSAIASDITFRTPDEKFKRHGQAVIAASLPELKS